MTRCGVVSLPTELGVFDVDNRDDLVDFFHVHGFATLRGLWDPEQLAELDIACTTAQRRLASGDLPSRYVAGELVTHLTEIVPQVRDAVHHPILVELAKRVLGDCWIPEGVPGDPFDVVFQDARPGQGSRSTRIGWHTDWQSAPHLDRWPAMGFSLHLDGTSPANGFLRVVPGSHRWATPEAPGGRGHGAVNVGGGVNGGVGGGVNGGVGGGVSGGPRTGGYTDDPPPSEMPLGFDKVPGEMGVYCSRGDVLFHDAYLWHASARATADGAVRRQICGGWYSGAADPSPTTADFLDNAAR